MNKKGFGLLELIIIVGILALLVGGGFYFSGFRQTENTIQTGSSAIERAKALQQQSQTQTTGEGGVINDLSGDSSASQ